MSKQEQHIADINNVYGGEKGFTLCQSLQGTHKAPGSLPGISTKLIKALPMKNTESFFYKYLTKGFIMRYFNQLLFVFAGLFLATTLPACVTQAKDPQVPISVAQKSIIKNTAAQDHINSILASNQQYTSASSVQKQDDNALAYAQFATQSTAYTEQLNNYFYAALARQTAESWITFTAYAEKYRDYLISESRKSYFSADQSIDVQSQIDILKRRILVGKFMISSVEFNARNIKTHYSYQSMKKQFTELTARYSACRRNISVYEDEKYELAKRYNANFELYQNLTTAYERYQHEEYSELRRRQYYFVDNCAFNDVESMKNNYKIGQGFFDDDENKFIDGLRLANRVLSTPASDGVSDVKRGKASEWAVKFKADLWDSQIKESESLKLTPYVEMYGYPRESRSIIESIAWEKTLQLVEVSPSTPLS